LATHGANRANNDQSNQFLVLIFCGLKGTNYQIDSKYFLLLLPIIFDNPATATEVHTHEKLWHSRAAA
jgi:hypothetical protein